MKKLRKHIRLDFLLFSLPFHQSWVKYAYLGFRKCYGSITKASETIFNKVGGGSCRPAGRAGCLLRNIPDAPPFFRFLCFSLFSFQNITKLAAIGVKLSEAIDWGPYANKQLSLDKIRAWQSIYTPFTLLNTPLFLCFWPVSFQNVTEL